MPVSSLMLSKGLSTKTTDKSGNNICIGALTPPPPELNSPFGSRKNRAKLTTGTIEAESQLWRSVLCQAIHDIYDRDERVRKEALMWVLSRDFITVCDFAFVEPDSMKEQIASLVGLPLSLARKYGGQLKSSITSS